MSLLQRLEMRQGQALVMTPQLLQAIKLLQLSQLDLAAYVDAELERNPLLERVEGEGEVRDAAEAAPEAGEGDFTGESEGGEAEAWLPTEMSQGQIEGDFDTRLDNVFPDDTPGPTREAVSGDMLSLTPAPYGNTGGSFDADAPDFDATLTAEISLREHLAAQLDLATRNPRDRLIGGFLIDAVDEAGYMREPIDDLAERLGTSLDDVARVLKLVQTFDPPGVAARDLAECLSLQLRELDRFDPAMQALVSRLDLVAKRDFASLRRLCGVDDEDLVEMLSELRRLDPKPGRAFGASAVEVLIPDVFVRMGPDGAWLVELNAEALPRVLVNQSYYARVARGAAADGDKAFLSECLQTANWLTRSLEQRARTILKVATEIVRQQDGFFVHGVAHLRPLNLKTVAEAIGMHESTVSRVTSNKSIGTSRGTLEMKYFFTAAIPGAAGAASHSSEAVRHRIKQLVDGERPSDVLSDDALVQRLRDEGIDIARRTVAKYRESLRIPSSIERRRDHYAHAGR
ncbi:RNA polymerase factor sigma-54 [Methylobacterium soli]|uniref:RNA polymerase sigma-54 factor n=1 Tax=Methylobacterium soli TaxID=553447 RepID=A0A6L3SZE5_9HYPH|nr:RNA polymerase factor sigma-54 [Methylobacterium soli]KAB1077537.1 RNA polymerase factor sigma-54 [Methylobacterium soli]GJE45201.1 RNA polymerase sigma-54 factor 2 [Methylobacterium soli]